MKEMINFMKSAAIATMWLCTFAIQLFGVTPEDQLSEANELYKKGEYKNAVTSYEQIIKQGYESSALYFNLGNAYYKMVEIPAAILNYERAKRLSPNDEDIQFNLALANLKTIDKIEPLPQFFLIEWYLDILKSSSSSDWAAWTIVFAFLSATFIILFLRSRAENIRVAFLVLSFLGILFTLFSFTLGNVQQKNETNGKEAIIFSPTSYVKSSPDSKSTDLFILHEGSKVEIMDTVGEWKRIKLANGNEGWLKAEDIEII